MPLFAIIYEPGPAWRAGKLAQHTIVTARRT
jgi:hypothetical protein